MSVPAGSGRGRGGGGKAAFEPSGLFLLSRQQKLKGILPARSAWGMFPQGAKIVVPPAATKRRGATREQMPVYCMGATHDATHMEWIKLSIVDLLTQIHATAAFSTTAALSPLRRQLRATAAFSAAHEERSSRLFAGVRVRTSLFGRSSAPCSRTFVVARALMTPAFWCRGRAMAMLPQKLSLSSAGWVSSMNRVRTQGARQGAARMPRQPQAPRLRVLSQGATQGARRPCWYSSMTFAFRPTSSSSTSRGSRALWRRVRRSGAARHASRRE